MQAIKSSNLGKSYNFKSLINRYDIFLMDVWGTIYDGIKPYPNSVDCLNYLDKIGKTVLYVSNSPRPSTVVASRLNSLGVTAEADMVVTAGDIVRYQLTHYKDSVFNTIGRRMYHLEAKTNTDILKGLNVNLVDELEQADFILLTVSLKEGNDLNQYDHLLKKAAFLNIPMICVNPDIKAYEGDKLRFCSGTFAEKYKSMNGKVHYYGKPYSNIYEFVSKKLEKIIDYDKNRTIMIGDSLETDIAGAKQAGIDSAIVLTGNMNKLMMTKSHEGYTQADLLLRLFKSYEIKPNWVLFDWSIKTS